MALHVTDEQLAEYKRFAREREARRQAALAARRERAWAVARRVAATLKAAPWNASRVVLYGSVATGGHFHERSDIDIAAAGIAPDQFFHAWAALTGLEEGFEVNLAPLESVRPALRAAIEEEGVEL